ncbi:MAG: hypothetical protein WKF94_18185 [Solirubrobacteraceae bacterium]
MLETILFAAEVASEEHTNHTAFYVAGGALALWAVIVSAIGIRGHADWPSSSSVTNGIMGVSAFLVVVACATAVITA